MLIENTGVTCKLNYSGQTTSMVYKMIYRVINRKTEFVVYQALNVKLLKTGIYLSTT